ncbi:hypothetical protein BU16DRAFT_8364 [Lophium mytilinum]|uniref:Secreted protein n=1 Tax=Lophium mytilinum TaxID=390894 RepID=A0A6A6RCM6_9PEZI|nr:hypothetical protein BU16DRAFT_8364 [Lophium mytilinum]
MMSHYLFCNQSLIKLSVYFFFSLLVFGNSSADPCWSIYRNHEPALCCTSYPSEPLRPNQTLSMLHAFHTG